MINTADTRNRTIIGCVLVVVAVVATMFIYVYPIRSYYDQRQMEKVERERLSVLQDANEKMRDQRKSLLTDKEIERIAREQYHLVKPGEEAYIVTGQATTTTTP